MTKFTEKRVSPLLALNRRTAVELMTPRPLSFVHDTPVQHASALLNLHELRAAPVIDFKGRPLGLVSASACLAWEDFSQRSAPKARAAIRSDWTPVSQIASPSIDLVPMDAPIRAVIDAFVERRVWRLFVTGDSGELAGAISMADVLRHLAPRCLAEEPRRRVRRAGASSLC